MKIAHVSERFKRFSSSSRSSCVRPNHARARGVTSGPDRHCWNLFTSDSQVKDVIRVECVCARGGVSRATHWNSSDPLWAAVMGPCRQRVWDHFQFLSAHFEGGGGGGGGEYNNNFPSGWKRGCRRLTLAPCCEWRPAFNGTRGNLYQRVRSGEMKERDGAVGRGQVGLGRTVGTLSYSGHTDTHTLTFTSHKNFPSTLHSSSVPRHQSSPPSDWPPLSAATLPARLWVLLNGHKGNSRYRCSEWRTQCRLTCFCPVDLVHLEVQHSLWMKNQISKAMFSSLCFQ